MTAMRFNHMELTLAQGALDPLRAEISRFYREIFGWNSFDVEILGQNALLLSTDDEVSQFVLVAESPRPLQSPGFDHLGILLPKRSEVDEVLEKCKAYRQEDDRVQIREYDDLLQGDVTVHAFYVKFLLPIFFDVQCIDWKEGSAPGRHWHYG